MADTWYLEVMPQQEPYDIDLDETGRAQVAFQVLAKKQPSDTFIEELVKVLTTVGTFGTDIFASEAAVIPTGDGPYLDILETPGPPPWRTHNVRGTSYAQPMALLTVRAKDKEAARSMALAAYAALADVRNQMVSLP